jgi:uncharacterized protein (TIGR04255 family)
MISEELHFDKAPIVEAVISIELEEVLPIEVLGNLKSLSLELAKDYPTVEDVSSSDYRPQTGSSLSENENLIGYFLKSADSLQVIHLKRTGFGFSRLFPYETWRIFFSEAQRTWELYRRVVGSANLAKFSIRYLNRLTWPSDQEVEEYLNIYPHVPDGLPKSINGYYMRVDYALERPYQGRLTQQVGSVSESQANMVSFVLDNEFNFAAIGLQDAELWRRIDSCQDFKNQIFLSSITQKMKERIS